MAVHWTIPFKSLRSETLYAVNIHDSNYSGTAVTLTGASNVVTIEEDDSDDMFTPIRRQSGYINIYDDGTINWLSIIPMSSTSRPVTITAGNSVVWQGFLQPQTFAGQLYGDPQVRQLPVCCALSVLDSLDIAAAQPSGVGNFGDILAYIFGLIRSYLTVGNIHIAGGSVNDWLYKRVDWANFCEDDAEGTTRAKYTAGQLLEEICKFWGWTARTYGTDIYLTAGDTSLYPAYCVYTWQELAAQTRTPSSEYWTTATLAGNIFASTNNEDLIMLGIHKATVTADINRYDSIMALDMEKYELWLDKNSAAISHTSWDSDTKHYFTRRLDPVEHTGQGEGVMRWDLGNCYLEIDVDTSSQPYYSAGNMKETCYYEGSLSDLHDIPFKPLLSVYVNDYAQTMPNFAAARIISKHAVSLDHGAIVVCGDTLINFVKDNVYYEYNGRCKLTCRLRVGDKYWDGQDWGYAATTFEIDNCGGNEFASGTGSIESNRVLDPTTFTSAYPNYNGFGVEVRGSEVVSGQLVFEILNLVSYGGQYAPSGWLPWCGFTNLEIKFIRELAVAPLQDLSSKEYHSTNNSFSEEVNVSTIFASDSGFAAGLGIIRNNDDSYCQEVDITEEDRTSSDHPEQYLADRIASFGNRIRRKLVVELDTSEIPAISPKHKVTIDSSTFFPAAISRDYAQDVTKLLLLEIDN